jgi:excisionase family DNA binding protein
MREPKIDIASEGDARRPNGTGARRTLSTEPTARSSARRPLLSPEDLASYLAVPLATVYRWRSRREGPRGYRIGRHVRYRLDDVERWLEVRSDAS